MRRWEWSRYTLNQLRHALRIRPRTIDDDDDALNGDSLPTTPGRYKPKSLQDAIANRHLIPAR